ncbi:MAG: helix-turn-helix domain-containing protein [Prevotella sp.]|nr:helix-turn-helix domain-containing protein [Prevotella sp.]
MNKTTFQDITPRTSKLLVNDNLFIDDDLLLFRRFEDVPVSPDSRKMSCLFVALCLEGSAEYTVDTKVHQVQKNDVIVINDGQMLSEYKLSPDCKGIAIMASNDFFAEIIKEVYEMSQVFLFAYSNPVFNLKPEKAATFNVYFNMICEKVEDRGHRFRRELAISLLKAMIYDIGNEIYQKQANSPKRTRAEVIFGNFIALVKDNFRHERRVSWYGEQLCITPKYLSETVKQVSRRTPNEWIDYFVVLEIRVLLKSSTLSIKEIAESLHFPNQSFLGKFFKEHVGVSPSKYRRL